MKPFNFHSKEKAFTSNDEDIMDLPALAIRLPDGTPAIVSCWEPTDQERQMLIDGFPLFLAVIGNAQPPVMLTMSRDDIGV